MLRFRALYFLQKNEHIAQLKNQIKKKRSQLKTRKRPLKKRHRYSAWGLHAFSPPFARGSKK